MEEEGEDVYDRLQANFLTDRCVVQVLGRVSPSNTDFRTNFISVPYDTGCTVSRMET